MSATCYSNAGELLLTHSCVGTKPFRPTPAEATRSSSLSIDMDRRALILPRAFSDTLAGLAVLDGGSADVGDMRGRVTSTPESCRSRRERFSSDCRALWLSRSSRRAFSRCACSLSIEALVLPLALFSAFFACSSFASCTRRTSRSPRARVNVPRSWKDLCETRIAYMRFGLSER
jgi:hypothetical protein